MADLLDDPTLRRVIVVAGIAEDQDRGLRPDVLAPLVPERLERVAVVGVAVDPDHVGLGVHPVDGLGDVLRALEEAGDLVDAVDEHEAANTGELRADGVGELEGEAREGGDRPGDVGDHEDLGLRWSGVAVLGLRRHPAVGDRYPVRPRKSSLHRSPPEINPIRPRRAGEQHQEQNGTTDERR